MTIASARWLSVSAVAALLVVFFSAVPIAAQGFKVTPDLRKLIDKGDYREAEKVATEMEPNDPILISWLKAKGGRIDEAIKYLEQARSLNLNADSAEEKILEITSIIADSSNEASISLLEAYLENESLANSSTLWLQLLLVYAGSPNAKEGEEVAKKVLALNPSPDVLRTPLFEYCVALYTQDEPQLALTYYLELRGRVPEAQIDPGYQLQFAHLLTAAGRPLDALSVIDGIRSDFKNYTEQNQALLLLASGIAHEALGDEAEAKSEFKSLLAIDSKQASGLTRLAEDSIRNLEENEEVRQLVDTSEDIPSQDIPKSISGSQVAFLIVIILMLLGIAWFLFARKMRGSAK